MDASSDTKDRAANPYLLIFTAYDDVYDAHAAGYILISFVPLSPSGKTDRRRLRQMGSKFTIEHISSSAAQVFNIIIVEPTNATKIALRDAWA